MTEPDGVDEMGLPRWGPAHLDNRRAADPEVDFSMYEGGERPVPASEVARLEGDLTAAKRRSQHLERQREEFKVENNRLRAELAGTRDASHALADTLEEFVDERDGLRADLEAANAWASVARDGNCVHSMFTDDCVACWVREVARALGAWEDNGRLLKKGRPLLDAARVVVAERDAALARAKEAEGRLARFDRTEFEGDHDGGVFCACEWDYEREKTKAALVEAERDRDEWKLAAEHAFKDHRGECMEDLALIREDRRQQVQRLVEARTIIEEAQPFLGSVGMDPPTARRWTERVRRFLEEDQDA